MSREVHVRFCEGPKVKFLRPTHRYVWTNEGEARQGSGDAPHCWMAGGGWLYLAVVVDLFARRVVGWASSDRLRKELPLAALRRALLMRRPPQGLIHHSDSQRINASFRAA
jgi:transposase InsO family protein